jgi:DNA-directed RNA polymerase specialized sigma24 family protein
MTRRACEAAELVRLAAAIDTLPMAERAVYLLGAVDGLDYPRIGFRLGLSVDEVERLTASAVLAVSLALDGEDERQKPQE